jgi:phosphopentomutase
MRRAIIIVIDSLGVGALPDAASYGDPPECNTLQNVAKANSGLHLPNMARMGLGNIIPIEGVRAETNPIASYGKMIETSRGKDTTTGHWELAGLVLEAPFRVYPNGFPSELVNEFIKLTNCGGILGNHPASGTDAINTYDAEHTLTGYPIIYTSADSVFQIACNTATHPLETLYEWCEIARRLLTDEFNVSRVIARPYERTITGLKRLNGCRRDLAIPPPKPTILNEVLENGGLVVGIGKIVDIFVGSGITHAVHSSNNQEGLSLTLDVLQQTLPLANIRQPGIDCDESARQLIFTNLVDTDSLYGHRNDPIGYGRALEEIDSFLPRIIENLTEEDLLIITGDHGCDPTVPGTDHTREYVPVMKMSSDTPRQLGTIESFTWVADNVRKWLI